MLVDGKLYQKNEVVKTILTGIDGITSTAVDTLPYGKYHIDESKSPTGYLKDDVKPIEFEINENGKIMDLSGEDTFIYNQIKRGDIEGVKIGDAIHKRLADVPFRILHKGMEIQESQNCTVITLRMKHRRMRWSVKGANNLAKALYRKENRELVETIDRYTDGLVLTMQR